MLIYWILFGIFAAGALLQASTDPARVQPRYALTLAALTTTILIGFRYDVGADWDNYVGIFRYSGRQDLGDALEIGDPGYQFLNWFAYQVGSDLWLVNLICAALFCWGLFRLCRTQPQPWAAALVAVPYLVIVVAMGYTRQAAALGVLMAGIATFLRTSSTPKFLKFAAGAAFFHKTAIVGFPLLALASNRNRAINFFIVIAVSIWLYDFFLDESVDTLVRNYIEARYSSQGAAIRVGMNLLAATAFWVFKDRLGYSALERGVWRNFSYAAVLSLILLLVLPSSTAVDRMALYLTPLQVGVLGRLPVLFTSRTQGVAALVAYAFAVQFVWLNFAKHAEYWIPYQFFPFGA